MDSERRHELETNDLREFLDNFKDFWDKHGNRLLIGLIIVLGGWLGYNRYNQWQADKADAAYAALNEAGSADALRDLAGEHSSVHDEAMRRGGDTALGEARRALIDGDDDAAGASLKAARSAYTALSERGATTEYKLVGLEGLAKVALMFEEWDAAAGHYNSIIDLAGEAFINHANRAQRALDRIDLLKSPVAFSPPEESGLPVDPDDLSGLLNDVPTFPNRPSTGGQPAEGEALPPLPLPKPSE